jgi:protein O-mannosyl-transferase
MSQSSYRDGLPVKGGEMDGSRSVKVSSVWYGILFIAVVTLLAYSSVFSAGFIWDDDDYVINNQHLRSLYGLFNIWFDPGATPQYYPMVFTLLWVQFHLWGLNPVNYHLVNILLHIVNALLLWLCLRRLKLPAAFWMAALFALHPVQVESVAWITELKNVLSLFFYLLSLLAYLRYSDVDGEAPSATRKRLYYTGSLLFFLLALFGKTVSGSLPAAILLIRWWQTGRIRRSEVVNLLPFFALAIILGRQTAGLEVSHVLAKGAEWDFSIIERILIAGRAVWFYAGKLFWPYPLIFNYPRWTIDAGVLWQYFFPLAFFSMLIILWRLRVRIGRGPLAAVLFFAGTLFPALGFFNIYPMRFSFVADHFQYIASIGVIVMFCAAISLLLQKLPQCLKHAETILFGAILLTLSILTWQQGKIYNSNLTLFNNTLDKNPASWFSYANRAVHYTEAGRDDLAMADLEKSLRIKPDEADALHTRGALFFKQKNFDRAFADFDRSIVIRPWRTDYYKNRCVAYRIVGRLDKALVDANKILELEEDDAGNYLLRASINLLREDYPAALGDLNKALVLDPEEADAWANRGLVYLRQGLIGKAIADFNEAIALRSDTAATFYNRALAFASAGNSDNASADLQQAKRLGYSVSDEEITRILSKVK